MKIILILILSSPGLLGIKVADILESEKVTPSSILSNKRVTGGFKVADILESVKGATTTTTTPSGVQNKQEGGRDDGPGVGKSEDQGAEREPTLSSKYPLITMTDDYNKDVPPKPKKGGPVQVDFYILLVDIRDINEVEEQMSLEYNLQMFWKDERLTQWDRNSSKFRQAKAKGLKYEVLSPAVLNDIWIPDTFIDHVKSMDQHKVLTTPASLRLYYSDGTFRFSGRFTMTIACQMQFHYYPADTQECPVNIKSYAYDNGTVFVSWRGGKEPAMRKSILLPNFRVGIGGAVNNKVETSSNIYSEIKFIVILRRFLGFHLIQTYLPSCLFVVISFLTFFVSSESVLECLTLCMTTLLTLTAMFASVKQNTPTVSYVKGLDIWMVSCIFCVFFTLVEHTVLLKLRTQITEKAKKEEDKKKLKKKRSLFNLTPTKQFGRSGSKGSRSAKPSTRPSQQPLTSYYNKGGVSKGCEEGESDSYSESSPNIQLRRYPQPTPPASIHLSPPSPIGFCPTNGMALNPCMSPSPAMMGLHQLSLSSGPSPLALPTSQDAVILSPLAPQFAAILSKKASKRFKLSHTVEILCSKLIPISFIVFNLIYWPWLLQSADYYNNEAFHTTNYV